MIGERYYGANASTLIGMGAVGISLVSLLSALATDIAVIEVGGSQAWSVAASIAGFFIGLALIASQETIGGILAILVVVCLYSLGVGVNFKQLERVVAGAYEGASRVAVAVQESGESGGGRAVHAAGMGDLFAGYVAVRPLNKVEAAQCRQGTASWTKSLAGLRNCSAKMLHCPADDHDCIQQHRS